ncbi:MAG: hypothetical protein QOJ09_2877, partial [Actinomycetota bacterium]|nr:hypothetical protein [Actinomycetota bacterium]
MTVRRRGFVALALAAAALLVM